MLPEIEEIVVQDVDEMHRRLEESRSNIIGGSVAFAASWYLGAGVGIGAGTTIGAIGGGATGVGTIGVMGGVILFLPIGVILGGAATGYILNRWYKSRKTQALVTEIANKIVENRKCIEKITKYMLHTGVVLSVVLSVAVGPEASYIVIPFILLDIIGDAVIAAAKKRVDSDLVLIVKKIEMMAVQA